MGNIDSLHLSLSLISLVLAGFFCSAETAFIGLQRLKSKHMVRLGRPNAEATYKVDGMLHLEEINEKLRLDLPAGDYDTIAGFVLSHLGHVPHIGEQLKHRNLRIIVSQMKGVKIEEVTITREKDATAPSQVQ